MTDLYDHDPWPRAPEMSRERCTGKERGGKMKKTQKPGKNKKTGAVIVILLGLLCAVSTVRSCGTKRADIQGKVDDVVYVGQGSYDPANDGRL